MAAAMARGWAAGDGGPGKMLFCDLDADRAAELAAEVGGESRHSLVAVRDDSDVLLLAVKPAALDDVAGELDGQADAIVSVMAATSLSRLDRAFPGAPVVRVMPNQPAEVRKGVLCYSASEGAAPEFLTNVLEWLDALGGAVELDETQIEAAMAVMSCSPAYVALFAEALAEAGAANGLAPELSLELVAGTLEGTAELLRKHDPVTIRAHVAPPGGATEAGLDALADGGMADAIAAAVEASLERFR